MMAALAFDLRGAVHSRCAAAGAPYAAVHAGLPIHRVSPGTVVFHDWRGERQNPGLGLLPAAVLMARGLFRTNTRPTSNLRTKSARLYDH